MKQNLSTNILKYFITIFTLILIPIYWHYYSFYNFLWLSDIGLFLTVIGLWLNSNLIFSMATVGILLLEIVWNIDFFVDLFTKINLIDLSDYMFNSEYPLPLRLISLFHVFVPIIWLFYLYKWGYNKKAFLSFLPLFWADILAVYLFSSPSENINWVFLPQIYKWTYISQPIWLLIMLFGFPLFIFLPMHFLLAKIFKNKH